MIVVGAELTGWGSYSPSRVLKNSELESLVSTTDDWIRSRTGIAERRIVAESDTTASMGVKAAEAALKKAGLSVENLELVICASTTPDYLLPGTSHLIQARLAAEKAAAFDINSACSGFVTALVAANSMIVSGVVRNAVVIGSESLSRFMNWKDRSTCILFGDGAAAVVLQASKTKRSVIESVLGSQGDTECSLSIPAGGSAQPASIETVDKNLHTMQMQGGDVFRLAVRKMEQAARECLQRAGISLEQISMVIPHQANSRIIESLTQALDLPTEKVFTNIELLGNTGAASVPIALSEYLNQGIHKKGDKILLVAFGGGFSWAASILEMP